MSLISKNITINKTARYFILGTPSEKIKTVWFVCHGYGQLAEYFIKKFEVLDNGENYVIAPEGLHRFYLKGFNGRIGASWMTKEARLDEINDYVNFLHQVYEKEIKPFDTTKIKVNLLGFSQGAPTVIRWFISKKIEIENMILWAHTLPKDKEIISANELLNSINLWLVVGNNDEFINDKRKSEEIGFLEKSNIRFNFLEFNGKHEIDTQTLLKLSSNLQ